MPAAADGQRSHTQRSTLTGLYRAALEAVDGRVCVREELAARALTGAWYAVAVGKAARAMIRGAVDALGTRLSAGIAIGKRYPGTPGPVRSHRIDYLEAAHPIPDESSLAAGDRMVGFIASVPADAGILLLVSGGASSLVEILPAGLTLSDCQRLNRWLLESGLAIDDVNRLRRRLSRLKGGGLLHWIGRRRTLALLISDVAGDDPRYIGSGLVSPGDAGLPQAPLPGWIETMLARTPAARAAVRGADVQLKVIAGNAQARAAAGQRAETLGLTVKVVEQTLAGDAAACGDRLAQALMKGESQVMVWGGETTVVLPRRPGTGGRNQHLALAAALRLAGSRAALLAAGTDGDDGSSRYAGAVVDGASIARGRAAGLDARDCLARCDAERFLEPAGACLYTGPTGTNVGDLVIGLSR